MTRHAFTVFVTGDSPRGQRAVSALRALCDRHLDRDVDITVVDVLIDAALAEDYNIVATPTVVRTAPAPPVRALGDLGDTDRVASALGIDTSRRPDDWNGRR